MSSTLASLVVEVNTAKANSSLLSFSGNLGKVSKKTAILGAKMTALSIPFALFAKSAVKDLAQFDDGMKKSLAIMGNVTESVKTEMREQALAISSSLPVSAKEAADSYFYLASAGMDAAQSLKALPVVANFATAGAFDMATATDLLTDAQTALGLSSDDTATSIKNMTMLSDLFVKGNTLANTSVQQLSEAMTNEAGMAIKQYRLDLNDATATLLAFADQGIKGDVAGSLFARSIRLLTKAADENTEAFAKNNITIYDANGELQSMEETSLELTEAFSKMSVEQMIAEMKMLGFSARTAQAILPLIGITDKLREYKVELGKAGGITQEVVDNQLKSLGVQFTLLKNNITNFGISLATTFEPQIRSATIWLKNAVEKFQALSTGTQKTIAKVILFTALLGPLVTMLGLFGMGVSGVVGLLGSLKAVFIAIKGLQMFQVFTNASSSIGFMNASGISANATMFLMAQRMAVLALTMGAWAVAGIVVIGAFKELKNAINISRGIDDTTEAIDKLHTKQEKLNNMTLSSSDFLKDFGNSLLAIGAVAMEVSFALFDLGESLFKLPWDLIKDLGNVFKGDFSFKNSIGNTDKLYSNLSKRAGASKDALVGIGDKAWKREQEQAGYDTDTSKASKIEADAQKETDALLAKITGAMGGLETGNESKANAEAKKVIEDMVKDLENINMPDAGDGGMGGQGGMGGAGGLNAGGGRAQAGQAGVGGNANGGLIKPGAPKAEDIIKQNKALIQGVKDNPATTAFGKIRDEELQLNIAKENAMLGDVDAFKNLNLSTIRGRQLQKDLEKDLNAKGLLPEKTDNSAQGRLKAEQEKRQARQDRIDKDLAIKQAEIDKGNAEQLQKEKLDKQKAFDAMPVEDPFMNEADWKRAQERKNDLTGDLGDPFGVKAAVKASQFDASLAGEAPWKDGAFLDMYGEAKDPYSSESISKTLAENLRNGFGGVRGKSDMAALKKIAKSSERAAKSAELASKSAESMASNLESGQGSSMNFSALLKNGTAILKSLGESLAVNKDSLGELSSINSTLSGWGEIPMLEIRTVI